VDEVEEVVDEEVVDPEIDVVVVLTTVVVGGLVGSVDDPQPDKSRSESTIPALAFMFSRLSARGPILSQNLFRC